MIAADILALDLSRIKLLVLSACETGRVAEDQSDEMVGFVRSIFVSGARSMISSGWLASDVATAHLMRSTYERWLKGDRIDQALCQSARVVLLQGDESGWSHPFFWANFQFWGLGLSKITDTGGRGEGRSVYPHAQHSPRLLGLLFCAAKWCST